MRRLISAAALCLLATAANAVPVTYVFSGYINQSDVAGPYAITPPDLGVEVGMAFNGVLNYDSEAMGCSNTPGGIRVCGSIEANPFWMVSFGSFTLTSSSPDVMVRDDSLLFLAAANQFLPSQFDGWDLLAQSDTFLHLSDSGSSTSFLDSPGAPEIPLFQQGYWIENAFIRPSSWTADGFMWNVGGTITSFYRVPEPATTALFGVGLLMVVVSTRRRTTASCRHRQNRRAL